MKTPWRRYFYSILFGRRELYLKRRCRNPAFICSVLLLFLAVFLLYDIATTASFQLRALNRFIHLQNSGYSYALISDTGNEAYINRDHGLTQECIHPKLDLMSKEAYEQLHKTMPIVCQKETDWVYTKDGRFYISADAVAKHGRIVCACVPLANKADTLVILNPIQPILNGTKLISDAFKVACKAADGQRYVNFHACISKYNLTRPPPERSRTKENELRLNVLMFGFDSVSRHMFQRVLPKTHRYFTETLGGNVLEGYNIVGDGTPQALMPILTGKSETDIPEVRRGMKNAKRLDEVLMFVWRRFQQEGYITQWGEDMANIGTFNLRMLGFLHQPVDHYMRPFYLAAIPFYGRFKPYCIGSRPRHRVFIDWIKEGLQTNKGTNMFTFGFFSEFSHNNNSLLAQTDEDIVSFLEFLETEGHLDNTVLILMSDHGVRIGEFRKTEQGKLEERMPYFGFRFPEKLKQKYPKHIRNVKTNTKRLVTPFDIHETLLDILYLSKSSSIKGNVSYRGISIFKEIPTERSCAHASIQPHWCACLQWNDIPPNNPSVLRAAKSVIDMMNGMLYPYLYTCSTLKLAKILRAISYQTNDNVLKFKESKDYDGRIPDMGDHLAPKYIVYQVTFETTPGFGLFEATVTRDFRKGTFSPRGDEMSRLNMYGRAADCIVQIVPKLRPYCECINQNSTKTAEFAN